MNTNTVNDQLTASLSNTLYPKAVNGGDNAIVAYNLDTGNVEQGSIQPHMTFAYVGIAPSTDPNKPGFSLKVDSNAGSLTTQGIQRIFCVKGSTPPAGTSFLAAHQSRLLDMKARLISLLQNESPSQQSQNSLFGQQQNQMMGGMQMPPTSSAAQFGGATNQVPKMGGAGFVSGLNNSSVGLFGSPQQTNPMTGGLFGSNPVMPPPNPMGSSMQPQQNNPMAGGLFGSNPVMPPSNPMGSVMPQQQNNPMVGGLFGSNPVMPPSNPMGSSMQQQQNGGLFGGNSTMPPPNPMGSSMPQQNGGLFGGNSAMPPSNPMGGIPFGGMNSNVGMFGTEPQPNQLFDASAKSILKNAWLDKKGKKGFSDAQTALITILKSCTNGNAARIFANSADKVPIKTQPQTPRGTVIFGLRFFPKSQSEIVNALQNAGGMNDPGIMYRFGVSSKDTKDFFTKVKGSEKLSDFVEAILDMTFETFSPEQITNLTTSYGMSGMNFQQNVNVQQPMGGILGMSMNSQLPTPAVGLPFGQTTNSLLSGQTSQPATNSVMGGIFGTASQAPPNLNQSLPTPSIPNQTLVVKKNQKKYAHQYLDEFRNFDLFENWIKDISAVVVGVKDGDTFDAGVLIPVKKLTQCRHETKGGRISDKLMCSINGNGDTDDELKQVLNVRVQNIDAAEFHIKVKGQPMQTTKEGWFAQLLMKKFFDKLVEDDADLRVDLHGLGMYKRHQGTFKLNGVNIGEMLCKMTYNGNHVAMWGYDGDEKSGFSAQFTKYGLKELTEDPTEIAAMEKATDEALVEFLAFFGDYKKNVSKEDSMTQIANGISTISISQSDPTKLAPPSGGLFGVSGMSVPTQQPTVSMGGLFGGSTQMPPASQNNLFKTTISDVQPVVPVVSLIEEDEGESDADEVDEVDEEQNVDKRYLNRDDEEPEFDEDDEDDF